jgi:hypothetical protein
MLRRHPVQHRQATDGWLLIWHKNGSVRYASFMPGEQIPTVGVSVQHLAEFGGNP